VKRQRDLEQQRAEAARTKATQDQLQTETNIRTNGFGVASLSGSPASRRRGLTSLLGAG
jgi:hypothetical protein